MLKNGLFLYDHVVTIRSPLNGAVVALASMYNRSLFLNTFPTVLGKQMGGNTKTVGLTGRHSEQALPKSVSEISPLSGYSVSLFNGFFFCSLL